MKIIKGRGLKSSTLKSLIQSGYDRSEVEGWTKVMDTPEVSAFKHNTTPQVVIVLRGTTGTANDWSNNAVYGIGGEVAYKRTPRYKRAVARVAEIEKKYNPKDITIVSHSQGGLLAELVPSKAREVITLNKATRPSDFIFGRKKKKNQYDIRSTYDPVSMFNTRQADYTIGEKSLNPLTQHSANVLDKTPDVVYGDAKFGNGMRKKKPRMKRGGMIVKSFNSRPENQFIDEPNEMF
jgi:hypothetical protein